MRLSLAALLSMALCGPASGQTNAPVPRAQRVVIMSIDGGRPDVVLRANTPNVRALCTEGSFTFWARTTELSVTLPSHASMLTGVTPDKHGIVFNKDVPEEELFYPKYPTIFELAKKKGLSTAMAAGKSKFVALCRPGSIDYPIVPEAKKNYTDAEVAANAAKAIGEYRPQVMLVHFGDGDRAGHAVGWGSPKQIAAMEQIDAGIGTVVAALKKNGLYDSTLIILSADHGGAARSHGKDDPRSRHIPWIAVGPGIRKNFDLTAFKDLVINTEDTFATSCAFMSIPTEGDIDGKAITQMLEGAELMQSATTKPATKPAAAKVVDVKKGLSDSYANPYPAVDAIGAGFKLNNSISAEFAVGADICVGATQPSDKTLPGWN
ncbi:MAG: ectonucleotide pyrophosphatase/phosphodiesterase [Planctomycetota bacterium]|nr:ectonucleotide pyrophosphatase/phosphodiesterase [Planctomycetota bacterium]